MVSLQGLLEAVCSFNRIVHFTQHTIGHAHLGVYGFYSMTMFGPIDFLMPCVAGREWPCPKLIAVHFRLVVAGRQPGVLAARVSFAAEAAHGQGGPARTTLSALLDAVGRLGYPAMLEGTHRDRPPRRPRDAPEPRLGGRLPPDRAARGDLRLRVAGAGRRGGGVQLGVGGAQRVAPAIAAAAPSQGDVRIDEPFVRTPFETGRGKST